MARPATLKEGLRRACPEGRQWARRQPNLRTAWNRCKRGHWMAWWLCCFRNVPMSTLRALAYRAGYVGTISTHLETDAQQAAYADLIRRIFKSSGRYR